MNEGKHQSGTDDKCSPDLARGPLGRFLASLDDPRARGLPPPELRALATRVLNRCMRNADPELADDLVGELLAQLCAPRRGRPAFRELIGLSEERLRRILRSRLHHLAVEQRPHWAIYKQLREHVAAVLEAPLAADAPAPIDLFAGARLSRERIASAVASQLATRSAPPREPGALTRALCARWLPTEVRIDVAASGALPLPSHAGHEQLVCDALDANDASRRLDRLLGPELARIGGQRLAGWHFQEIADANGIGLATAHARIAEIQRRLARLGARYSPGALRIALQRLAAQAGPPPKGRDRSAV
jgi:hypothetical protein